MNQNRSHLLPARAVVILLLAFLLLSACRTTAPVATPAASTTPMATATRPPTLSPTRTPTPTATATTTPTPTPVLFDTQLQPDSALDIAWGSTFRFTDYIEAGGQGLVVGVDNYPDDVVYVVDAHTGQEVWSYQAVSSHHRLYTAATSDTLYVVDAGSNDFYAGVEPEGAHQAEIRAYALPAMQPRWSTKIGDGDIIGALASEAGLILIKSQQMVAYQLDPATGDIAWQKVLAVNSTCSEYFDPDPLFLFEDKLWVGCGQRQVILDIASGEVLKSPQAFFNVTDPTYAGEGVLYRGRHVTRDGAYFLEALDVSDLQLTQPLWTYKASEEFYTVAAYAGDAILQDGKDVVRLDQKTGEPVWRTEVSWVDPQEIRVVGSRILIGSVYGYLHLLNAETGELVWEQDIWSSFEPHYMIVNPLAMSADGILLNAGRYPQQATLFLSFHGRRAIPTASPEPTQTPKAPTPRPPTPVFTPLAPGELPPPPQKSEHWPDVILHFLNAAPGNLRSLDKLLAGWEAEPGTGDLSDWERRFKPEWKQVDLTGDRQKELLILLPAGGTPANSMLLVLRHDPQTTTSPAYELLYLGQGYNLRFYKEVDLDRDGQLELVYRSIDYPPHSPVTTLIPLKWNGTAFVPLAPEPIESTNVDKIQVQNLVGDGKLEISLHGGTYNSASAGDTEPTTFIYALQDGQYRLHSQKRDEFSYYDFLMDGNALVNSWDAVGAIDVFEQVLSPQIMGKYGNEHIWAFAEYQLMLAYLMQGDEAQAEAWATTDHYPDQIYTEIKDAFWKSYSERHQWDRAAEAARTFALQNATYDELQFVRWVGYANQDIGLDEICPCEQCRYQWLPGQF